jgi:beta-1,4-N-acetylglucosaminyltransferase
MLFLYCIMAAASVFYLMRRRKSSVLLIILGSGGHTSEMFRMLKHLPRNVERVYLIANTDQNSLYKVKEFEKRKVSVKTLPRSRSVHQSWFTTVFTTLRATLSSLIIVWSINPSVVLCNGPGTCVPVCIVSYIYAKVGILKTKIVFVESFARVKNLSLTGKILYCFADRFLVQW